MPLDLRTEKLPGNPVEIISGPGALAQIFTYTDKLGCPRVLVVCGKNVSQLSQVAGLASAAPATTTVEVFDQVEPDPSDRTIAAGGTYACSLGADIIVAIGGGSSMDAGKAIAAEAGQEGWIFSQECAGQPTTVPDTVLPLIAVPTTAGTGSEVTPFSVITFTETHRKLVLNHEAFYPKYAVLDPTLLTSTPRVAQVAAGMDALTHAVESYISKEATGPSRKQARETIKLIARHFRAAIATPGDLEAQAGMQRAAMMAGLAFSVSRLGIVHAMALPLSALFGVPHGVANAILLPFGMEFNRRAAMPEFANIVAAMGVSDDEQSIESASRQAVAAVRELAQNVGAPQRMSEVGVDKSAIGRMAADAIESPHISRNPRTVCIRDIVGIYERAY